MSVYNGGIYLEEAIESILNQTYKDFEFIIINDGSTDESLEVIERNMKKDERIVLISRENKGLISSLNEGISISKGEFIARMDADDICILSRFEEQLNFMEINNLDLCGSWIQPFDDKKEIVTWKYLKDHRDIIFMSFFMTSFAHPSVMMKKNIFNDLKYENETAEDYKLWTDIIRRGYKVGNIQKVLLKYRMHENQITQIKSKELLNSSNNIASKFASDINKELSFFVNLWIEIQTNNSFNKFKQFLFEINNFSKKYKVSKEGLAFIVRKLYDNSSPKNMLMYGLYIKNIKGSKKNIKEELKIFIKSLITINRESVIYKMLKQINMKNKL